MDRIDRRASWLASPFRMSSVAALALVWAASAPVARAAEPAWSHHRAYSGHWAGSAAFKEIRASIERERIAALGSISRSLGLELRGDRRVDGIVFEYVDEADAPALGFPAGSRGGFRPPKDPAAAERVITVIVDKFVSSRDELPGFVCHEMIHAVMSLLMGESFTALPSWVQEGLAVYGSGQGTEKLAKLVANEGAEPKGFPDGLDQQKDRLADYVEAYLAIAFLADSRGPQAVRAFTAAVVKGVPVDAAVQQASQLAPKEFAKRAAEYARARVRSAAATSPAPSS